MDLDFLNDWKFWSFAVSAIALVLSQLPPIKTLIRSTRLEIDLYQKVYLTHKVGYPNFHAQLILRNTGGRDIRISNIRVKVFLEGKEYLDIPAVTQVDYSVGTQPLLVTPFDLQSGDEWNRYTCFYGDLPRSEDRALNEALNGVLTEIRALKAQYPDGRVVYASPQTVAPVNAIFEKVFKWNPGDYTFQVFVETDRLGTVISNRYRFTIFEFETEVLRRHQEAFPTGGTLWWEDQKYSGIWCRAESIG